jgi:hypothetical protein
VSRGSRPGKRAALSGQLRQCGNLGHKSIQSTTAYAQISDSRRNRTMRRLEKSRNFPLP